MIYKDLTVPALSRLSMTSALAATFLSYSGAANASVAEDTVDVPHLIGAYHQAVLDHDGARLSALFVPEGSAWFSVLTDQGLARVRARKVDTPKLRPGSAQDFIKMVATSKSQLDPRHSHLRVKSDGAIATVTFGFTFMIDGRPQNKGSESWQVVKGEQGWRIASIIYSSTPPAV